MAEDNKTCARIEVFEGLDDSTVKRTLFVKSVWEPTKSSPTSFSLAITDGCQAWTFEGSEAYVRDRAEVWDKKVSWVMEKFQFYLMLGQPGVTYRFTKTRDDSGKLSFEIQDIDTNLSLKANFLLLNASSETVTSDLIGFLLHGNEILSEKYRRKCRDFDQMNALNKALLEQCEQYKNEVVQFKNHALRKFVEVLNSKKSKCRELKKENARLQGLVKSKEEIEKDYSTSSSDDDEEEFDPQVLSPEKRMERGEGSGKRSVSEDAVINADPDATQPFVDQVEMDPPKEDPPSNAVAALVPDAPYAGLQRKRRRT